MDSQDRHRRMSSNCQWPKHQRQRAEAGLNLNPGVPDDSDVASQCSSSSHRSGSTVSSRPLLDLKEYFDSQPSEDELDYDYGKIYSQSSNSMPVSTPMVMGEDVEESLWTSIDYGNSQNMEVNKNGNSEGSGFTSLADIFGRAFGSEAKAVAVGEKQFELESETDTDVDSLMSNLSMTQKEEVGVKDQDEQSAPEENGQRFEQFQFHESGETTEYVAPPAVAVPSGASDCPDVEYRMYESPQSDTDDSATTVCSPRSNGSWMTSTPTRRLLRKSPIPIAAVPPMRRSATLPFRKCDARPSKVERKMKTVAPEKKGQGFGSTETKRLVQRVLHDYFKVKKRKKHYKKENKSLKSKLERHVLEFDDPSDSGFKPEIFKDNISQRLSKSLKSHYTRDVLAVVKSQSQVISSQASSMSQRPITKPCGCLLFDDEIVSSEPDNSKLQKSNQTLIGSQSSQRTSQTPFQNTQNSIWSQFQDTQKTSETPYQESQESQLTISPLQESSQLFSPRPCPIDLLSMTPRFFHSF